MAVGKISELVDDAALAQLDALFQKLGITTQAMVTGTEAATGYINAIGKVNSISEFNAANQQAATVMGEVKEAQQKVITIQQQATTATNQLVESTKANAVAGADASAVLQKLGGAYEDSIRLLIAQKIELGQVNAQLKEQARAFGDSATGQARSIETTTKLTQQQLLLKEAIAQNTLIIRQQTKEQLAAETSNDIYMAQLNQMIKLQNALSVEERENTVYGRELQAQITATKEAVVAANQAQGKFNDNVGNYPMVAQGAIAASEASTKAMEENAVAATTDAEAQTVLGLATGKQAKESETANATVEKTGKAFDVTGRLANVLTSRIFRMAASFLLITVALGAITWLYEYIKNLDIFTGRLDQATQNLKALNDVQKDVSSSTGEIVGKYRILSDTVKDLSISYEDRLRAAEELKKLFPQELEHSTAQAIANGEESASLDKLTDSVVKLAKAKAAAQQIEKTEGEIINLQIQRDKVNSAKAQEDLQAAKATAATIKEFGGEKAVSRTLGMTVGQEERESLKGANARSKMRADAANKDIAEQIAIKENTIKYLEQYGGLQKESETLEGKDPKGKKGPKDKTNDDDIANAKAHLELVKAIAKETLDNEKLSYDQRLAALKVFTDASNKLIELERKAKNRKATTGTERDTANTEAKTQGLGVLAFDKSEADRLAKERLEKLKKELQDALKLEDDYAKKAIQILQDQADDQLLILDVQKNKEETLVANKYKKGLVDEKEYRRELKRIADQYNIDRLGAIAFQEQSKLEILEAKESNDVSFARGVGSVNGESPEKTATKVEDIQSKSGVSAQKRVVAKAGISLNDAVNSQVQDNAKDNKEVDLATKIGYLQQLQDDASKIVQANYENEITLLEKRKQLIQETADYEVTRVQNSILSSKEKAREESVIREQARQQQLQVDAQITKVKQRQAEYDRALSIANIIENTAVGVSKAAGSIFGLPLVPIIAALGAAQLATVLATPLPKFEKGGTVAKDGDIITGEVGTELRIDPSGAMSLTDSKANVSYAKAGTKIISNRELMNIVGKPEPIYYVNDTRIDNKKLEKLTSETNQLLRNTKRPLINVVVDRWGDYSRQRNY